jgi:hypothetical protein
MLFIPDIDLANQVVERLHRQTLIQQHLIGQWGAIAKDIANHCRHKYQGECLIHCRGLAVCDTADLTRRKAI